MSAPEPGLNSAQAPRPLGLTDHDLERLRAAGRWARGAVGAGAVAVAVGCAAAIALGLRDPRAFVRILDGLGRVGIVVVAASVVTCLAAMGLIWGYARGVAASFVRGDAALVSAFRRLRLFFVVWTCGSALTLLYSFLRAWRKF